MDLEFEIIKDLAELLVCNPLSSLVFLWLLMISRQKTIGSGGPRIHEAFKKVSIGRGARVNQVDGKVSGKRDCLPGFHLVPGNIVSLSSS